jgi:hypothetical protein
MNGVIFRGANRGESLINRNEAFVQEADWISTL